MQLPTISIVMPSLNSERYIGEAIESVLTQNYPNLEFIVIDGGSTDNTKNIIQRYEKYLAYWISEKDNGHCHALNKGFSRSTGTIMAWLNSDDKYVPGAFSTVAEVFSQFPDVHWLVGKNSWWNKAGQQTGQKYVYKNIYDYLLGDYKWIQQESVFWRRTLWEKAGSHINEDYTLMVDGELWTRFFLEDDLWHLDAVLGGYRVHDTNRAALFMDRVLMEMERAIEELQNKVVNDAVIMYNLEKIKKSPAYTNQFVDYKAIIRTAAGWKKEYIKYSLNKGGTNNVI